MELNMLCVSAGLNILLLCWLLFTWHRLGTVIMDLEAEIDYQDFRWQNIDLYAGEARSEHDG